MFKRGFRFATCPITEGALVRFHLRVGAHASVESARTLLKAISALPRHQFWSDSVSYTELTAKAIRGHGQVTDAYLAMLATANDGLLATMDEGLAALHPGAELI